MTGLADLGQRVAGQVLDETAWQDDSRVLAARPARHVIGEVCVVYPLIPEVAGVVLPSGVRVTVRVGGIPACEDCGHDGHELGDCAAAVWGPQAFGTRGVAQECPCGVAEWLRLRDLADQAWEAHIDAQAQAAVEAEL